MKDNLQNNLRRYIIATSYFGFSVSNTNGNSRQYSCVRVYNNDGKMIAEQLINKHNPLGYVRKYLGSKHRISLKTQCLSEGMTSEEFEAIF